MPPFPAGSRARRRARRPVLFHLGLCGACIVAAGALVAQSGLLAFLGIVRGGGPTVRGCRAPRGPWRARRPGPCVADGLHVRCAAGEASSSFQEGKEALKRCLAREYRSFFRPFEADYYAEDVTFKDPLNDLKGKERYRQNVEMLSGDSPVGNLLFRDGWIDLHAVEDVPGDERRVRTRWTLGFTFKLLPWQPQALFSGVSEYAIDAEAKVLSQRDYWDTLSLGKGGAYAPEAALAGVAELGAQLLPRFLQPAAEPEAASAGDWSLLRRAEAYRVYRAQDGLVFAIGAPGVASDRAGLERSLRSHGLSPGAALQVSTAGRGQVFRAGEGPSGSALAGVELLPPHPWEGPAPEG
uniref:Uncharacterized protein n=1 Tax=Alexandrium monilatum TaxID=311494 RepID=A0A7S4UFM3_9DINO